jgi:transcriptional regulator with XRE-family HTH domain
MGQSKPGLRVRETARRVGISAAHVSKILAGHRQPSLDVARRIAKACGMSLQSLVDLMDRSRPKPS